jgi:hypothetical protein
MGAKPWMLVYSDDPPKPDFDFHVFDSIDYTALVAQSGHSFQAPPGAHRHVLRDRIRSTFGSFSQPITSSLNE